MFGSGVPVCAASFPAANELVKHGMNGLLFTSAKELEMQLCHLFDIEAEDLIKSVPRAEWTASTGVGGDSGESGVAVLPTITEEIVGEGGDIHEDDDEEDFVKVNLHQRLIDVASSHSSSGDLLSPTTPISPTHAATLSYSYTNYDIDMTKLTPLERLRYHASSIESWENNWFRCCQPVITDLLLGPSLGTGNQQPKPKNSISMIILKGILCCIFYSVGKRVIMAIYALL